MHDSETDVGKTRSFKLITYTNKCT